MAIATEYLWYSFGISLVSVNVGLDEYEVILCDSRIEPFTWAFVFILSTHLGGVSFLRMRLTYYVQVSSCENSCNTYIDIMCSLVTRY